MFDVALHRPEIPPNTGNLMRLCVNTGNRLHLIEPLGFTLDHARLRRAGLDYREYADVAVHPDFDAFLRDAAPRRVFAYSQHAERLYTDVAYSDGDALVFGRESDGLPASVIENRLVDAVACSRALPLPTRRIAGSLQIYPASLVTSKPARRL